MQPKKKVDYRVVARASSAECRGSGGTTTGDTKEKHWKFDFGRLRKMRIKECCTK
jgi:hypothetical protein